MGGIGPLLNEAVMAGAEGGGVADCELVCEARLASSSFLSACHCINLTS